jgi:hypothetical protein
MMPAMETTLGRPRLQILPGEATVLFLVTLHQAATMLAVPAARFLDGLKSACALLSFGELFREEDRLDELLPWAGNV